MVFSDALMMGNLNSFLSARPKLENGYRCTIRISKIYSISTYQRIKKMTSHFNIAEMVSSYTAMRLGIDNTPGLKEFKNIEFTIERLELLRALLGHPITVLSGYRSERLNRAVGGVANSQHVVGQAADIIAYTYGDARALAKFIRDSSDTLRFDQLILEFNNWVHISFSQNPREEILTIRSRAEGYLPGLVL